MGVAMGGYNTTCELLALGKKVLIVPRVSPRREQWLRASCLHKMGLVDLLHPNDVTPANISSWLRNEETFSINARPGIDMNGLEVVADLVSRIAPDPQNHRLNQHISNVASPHV